MRCVDNIDPAASFPQAIDIEAQELGHNSR